MAQNTPSSNVSVSQRHMKQPLAQLRQALPLHGGDIQAASQRYHIPQEHWIDLSTGMNPEPYPIPALPAQVFEELPYWQPNFLKAVETYYGQKNFLATPGSQAVIQYLPPALNATTSQLLPVLVPQIGYQEHAQQWQLAGNVLHHYRSQTASQMISDIDRLLANNPCQHLVIIRPNNPTGITIESQQLSRWAAQLQAGGRLIVDEAFIDLNPADSLLTMNTLADNMIICRSFGKFFGLAGIRLGFVFAPLSLLDILREKIGIWAVNGPAQYVATEALLNVAWQTQALNTIASNAEFTEQLFTPLQQAFPLRLTVNAQLFLSYSTTLDWALALNHALAKAGILTRVVAINDNQALLRIGCLSKQHSSGFDRVSSMIQQLCQLDNITAVVNITPDAVA